MPVTISGTDGVSGVDGSAASPSVKGLDANTGVAFAADKLTLSTGGSDRFHIASAGQLGIAGANYGTDGQVLTSTGASSAPAWEAVSSAVASRGAFMAGGSGTNQDVAHNTTVTMEFAEVFDQEGWFNDSTNIYTPQVAGYYWFSLSCWFNNYPNTDNCEMSLGTHIRKNDSTNYSTQMEGSNDWFESYTCRTSSILLLMNGSSDNVRFQVYQWNGNSETTKLDKSESFVSGFLVHAT